ncbi:efflux RND transporter periplasmic adaptor subunit [Serratia quinivorans]|uniref:efflux RND transporter periplasmic adaptor subunit n=1 Tax=Serratia quinivorans TaxID=137545 RepID=UPI00217878C4|nr:HlyD family efflux transporter periplasmic adaptor subunit [Serratia quinivorans]CAI0969882.1 putative efflux pump membrane fusion protein [Serratia quinivorans]CAI1711297.1 putative efflux pump membrane fusion protein [Serratia quinivorans]
MIKIPCLSSIKKWKKLAISFSSILFVLIIIVFNKKSEQPQSGERWYDISNSPLSQEIGLVGKIEPYESLDITIPFNGTINKLYVEPGQKVEAGKLLLSMDTEEIDRLLRMAESDKLTTQKNLYDLKHWESSPAVARAKRSVHAARTTADKTHRTLTESRLLLERGIIPRSEVENLEHQLDTQQQELILAKHDLKETLKQGVGEPLKIAEMLFENARLKYESLKHQRQEGRVVAPFIGVLVSLEESDISTSLSPVSRSIQAGSKVMEGQAAFRIVNTEQLKTTAIVSEMDLHLLKVGQKVKITGDGFRSITLNGTVENIDFMARQDKDNDASAEFPVTIRIEPIPESQRSLVRPGMSTNIRIETYYNDNAVVLPTDAIVIEQGKMHVVYRPKEGDPVEMKSVKIGRIVKEGVEVSGLSSGQVRLHP